MSYRRIVCYEVIAFVILIVHQLINVYTYVMGGSRWMILFSFAIIAMWSWNIYRAIRDYKIFQAHMEDLHHRFEFQAMMRREMESYSRAMHYPTHDWKREGF